MSWWRRNLWGLIALLPAIAALIGVNYRDAYGRYWEFQPRVPVSSSGWVEYAGSGMRLAELTDVTDQLKDYSGDPVVIPGGVRAWRAVVEFRYGPGVKNGGCSFHLEDDHGRVYGANPRELSEARVARYASCEADETKVKDPSAGFRVEVFFIAAPDSRPVAVRIVLGTSLPRYARLTLA
ncbi:hypothetical protein F4553_003981 [Allocatelliglobosispora scoriae]|uniref:Uncharacterized protein n=1 Tax=Allocatelliglobosispora scoriae TaxID=643052 RepID=A0A841BV26_9ACTN|nr:hypothetical protein [Allocatelliglobosispora scoriae]MBB5870602.1 hypothetical protein [Allocatelliglobosispora scoriae]